MKLWQKLKDFFCYFCNICLGKHNFLNSILSVTICDWNKLETYVWLIYITLLYQIITQFRGVKNWKKYLDFEVTIKTPFKENRPPCCRWRKIYRNHCLIEDICGWNIIQTRFVVCTANPVTEICDGPTYARYCLCLHLFPATEFCLKPWLR